MSSPTINFGILLDATTIPKWISDILLFLDSHDKTNIAGIFFTSKNPQQYQLILEKNIQNLLLKILTKFEHKIFKLREDGLLLINQYGFFQKFPQFEFRSLGGKKENYSGIDYFLNLSNTITEKKFNILSNIPVIEVSFFHELYNYGMPLGIIEVLTNFPLTESCTHLKYNKNSYSLFKHRTVTHPYSIIKNINRHVWKIVSDFKLSIIPLLLQIKSNSDKIESSRERLQKQKAQLSKKFFIEGLIFKKLLKDIGRYIQKKIFYDQWIILYNNGNEYFDFEKYTPLIPKRKFGWADPFIMEKNNHTFIFFEELLIRQKKAHLSVIELSNNDNCKIIKKNKFLTKPYHLSYPGIFEYENELYLIPESSKNKTIDLYRCIDFPDKWQHVLTLLNDLIAVDPTIFYFKNKWWLFFNKQEIEWLPNYTDLYLYYSDSLFSTEWISHPQNPVVSDIQSSRPAGKIFIHENKIFRPSQNSLTRYGYGLKINEILVLNETEYNEREVYSFGPKWNKRIKGIHTFNSYKGVSVIDVRYRRLRLFPF